MANRTTVKNNIITKNVPTVTNAKLSDMLNNELADNVRFREDVAVVQNATASAITVDFTGKDRVDLTRTGGSLNITVSGIGDGETKYLLVNKTAGQSVTWVGVTDVTPIKTNADSLSIVVYEIIRKGSYYYAIAIANTVLQALDTRLGVIQIATQAEHNSLLSTTKAAVPGRIPTGTQSQKGLLKLATDAEYAASNATVPARADQVKSDITNLNTAITTLDAFPKIRQFGFLNVGDTGSLATITVPLNSAVPNTNYVVGYTLREPNYVQDLIHGIGIKTVNNFTVVIKETVSHIQNLWIDWFIIY